MYSKTFAFIGGCWIATVVAHDLLVSSLFLVLLGILSAVGSHFIRMFKFRVILRFFLAGFMWSLVNIHFFYPSMLQEELQSQRLIVVGVVDSFPVNNKRGVSFTLNIESFKSDTEQNTRASSHSGRLKLSWYKHRHRNKSHSKSTIPLLKPGDRWQLVVKLKQPTGFRNAGSFDYERWLFKHRFVATGYITTSKLNKRLAVNAGSWLLHGRFIVDQYLTAAAQKFNMSQTHIGLIRALALGERGDISAKQWRVLRNTGTAHLVAISGLHIGLAAGIAYLFVMGFWRRWMCLTSRFPAQKAGAIGGIIVGVLYAALAGFAIPTQRALVMVIVIMGFLISNRLISRGHVLCIALLVVLLLDPLAIMEPGFWLSFVAVGFMFLAAPLMTTNSLKSWIGMQWLLLVCLAPLTIMFFQTVSIAGPIANMLVLPLFSILIVPLILLTCVLLIFSTSIASWVLVIAAFALQGCWFVLERLSTLNISLISMANDSLAAAVFAFAGLIILLLSWSRRIKLAGMLLLIPLALPVLMSKPHNIERGSFVVTILDSGQGLATVVRTAHYVLLYDTGAKYSALFDIGRVVIVPYLRSLGVNTLDMVIVSHADNDHRGGFDSVAREMPIKYLLSGAPLSLKNYKVMACHKGQSWIVDGVQFDILHPVDHNIEKGNDKSCVLRVHSKAGSVLLTGDIHRSSEQKLYESLNIQSDVLIIPHHGSKTSSAWAFIRAVDPQLAIISAGFKNRFHLPSSTVMKRYEALKIPVLNTVSAGAIDLKIGPEQGSIQIKRFRPDNHRFWHRK